MSDLDSLLKEAIAALEQARVLIAAQPGPGGDGHEQLRRFYQKLFSSQANVAALEQAVAGSNDDEQVIAAVNTIAGADLALGATQIAGLRHLFGRTWYGPIKPGSAAVELQGFYLKLFRDRDTAAIQDLQANLGTYWVRGRPTEDQLIETLRGIEPGIAWDSRHVFALLHLLFLDADMRDLAPYSSSSIW